MASRVYWADLRTDYRENLPQKLTRLMKTAGMGQIDFEGKFTAIKLHFGEPGNLAFLRPNWAKTVADFVKERGGKPFLTDCNTLYVGGRKNALDHMDAAMLNGFSPLSTGCQIIIADGLKGNDEVEVPVRGGEYVEKARIGRAVMDADVFISLSHFKGHEEAGFGGALKNIGMGCGSRAGKMEQHNAGKPHVAQEHCVGCGACTRICAHSGITVTDRKATIDHSRCVGCGRCIAVCPRDAIRVNWDETVTNLNRKIAEYAQAVVDGRPCFHISLVIDVSPNCDCHPENDAAIIPNVGMFASFDPVALDMACADAVNAQPPLPGAAAAGDCGHDHFHHLHPETDWMSCLEHAEKLGMGRACQHGRKRDGHGERQREGRGPDDLGIGHGRISCVGWVSSRAGAADSGRSARLVRLGMRSAAQSTPRSRSHAARKPSRPCSATICAMSVWSDLADAAQSARPTSDRPSSNRRLPLRLWQ